ncbi:hypothetical protein B0H13DRAFT_795942 [Mycena leptocephala]|nr:hypothetical protein B0H13DRAFT_795942 [Mycena leptocephala]
MRRTVRVGPAAWVWTRRPRSGRGGADMGGFNAFHYGLVFYLPLKENIDTRERGRQNNNVFDAPLTLDLCAMFALPFHNAKTGNGEDDATTPTARRLSSPCLSPTRISRLSSRRRSSRWTRHRARLQQPDVIHLSRLLLATKTSRRITSTSTRSKSKDRRVAPSADSTYDNPELESSGDGAEHSTDSTAPVRGETRFRLGRLGRGRGCEFGQGYSCRMWSEIRWGPC